MLAVTCGVLSVATVGCAGRVTSRSVASPPAPHYALMSPMSKLPHVQYRTEAGAARVEAEVTSSSVEPTSVQSIGGGGSSSWSPPHATRPGHRWMTIRAYGTNETWDYPPLDLGEHEAALTVRGKPVNPGSAGRSSTSAVYRRPSAGGLPPLKVSNIQNAQVFFEGVYEVSSVTDTYTLTWDLGKAGTARIDFRF